jgi:hypothetical protein
MFRRFSPLVALAFALTLPAVAHAADDVGATGYVQSLQVNTKSSDAYLQMHGRLILGTKHTSTEYRWGGTSCGSRVLDPDQVALLNQALINGLQITPLHRDGQGSVKCLVGFTMAS